MEKDNWFRKLFIDEAKAAKDSRAAPSSETAYENGYNEGKEVGAEAAIEERWNTFWDRFQNNGKRILYNYAFYAWDFREFKPKYDIAGGRASFGEQMTNLFYGMTNSNVDLTAYLESINVRVDTTYATSVAYMYAGGAQFTRVPGVQYSPGYSIASFCHNAFAYGSRLETIDLIALSEDGSNTFSGTFMYCSSLKNITITGTIGQNGFNVQWSPKLTHDSLMSIINVLADKSTDTSGTVWKVTIGSENYAKLTADEIRIAEQKGWIIE